jgi:hypothetical protein
MIKQLKMETLHSPAEYQDNMIKRFAEATFCHEIAGYNTNLT